MTPYIIFNGISSDDFSPEPLIIEQLPDVHKPARFFEEIQIPGRDGRATADLGGFDIYQTNLKINCTGHTPTEIYAWLNGEGWLTTSDDPEYMCYVAFYEQAKDQRFRADTCYDTITIPLRVQPYKYKAAQTPLSYTGAAVFTGEGNANAKPILEITGSGDITLMVNSQSVLIDDLDGTIILDCDAEIAYSESGGVKTFMGRYITVVDDEWPQLEPDTNSISWSGSVSQVVIHPWWRWI